MDSFARLNAQQRRAVETTNGRLLVLAGAGSGKTQVLTLRMAHLIKNCGVSPKSLLGLTFTNKAAAEMRQRLASLTDKSAAKQVVLCTFHSFCMQVLRQEIIHLGYTPQFTLCNEKDVQRIVSTIARDLLEHEGALPSMMPTIEAISWARNQGVKAHEVKDTGSAWHDEFTSTVYRRLQDSMRAYNIVDFDSLLSLAVELFEQHPAILERYQERYRYIMIDEYQDTNPIQYRLASLLAAKYQHLCVVGDDDQSIYGWRGADVQHILEFPNATIVKLEQNYRSTNTILKSANALIAHNTKRHGKALWSNKGDGPLVEVFHAPTEKDEAEAVVCRMDRLRQQEGLKWGDMAILYRSNQLSRPFEQALVRHAWQERGGEWVRGVPYQIFGGSEFYEKREIQDLLAYLRVIVNPSDQEALLRVINHPRRGIGEGALDLLTAYNRQQEISLWSVICAVVNGEPSFEPLIEKISTKAFQGLKTFVQIIAEAQHHFSKTTLAEGVKWLIDTIDYRKAIHEEVKSEQMRAFKWENVEEFIAATADHERHVELETGHAPSLHDYILSVPLERDWEGASKQRKEDHVTLMTFHSAKGLEFPACFLVGIEDHIIPHEKSIKDTGVEEERRLMYVAITRAMQFLTISMARQRKRMGEEMASQPSRFLNEIPKEFLNITRWNFL